ncbi:hypothetical protein BDW02DRAFT_454333, partial [Decorospora gaudefroyi]
PPLPNQPSFTSPQTPIHLIYHTGSIFHAPRSTLLIHACNTHGIWGTGIALAFKKRYPHAFRAHRTFCLSHPGHALRGTALLIPPMDGDKQHWIGCLFTSMGYGRQRDGVQMVLRSTRSAVRMLVERVGGVNAGMGDGDGDGVREWRMCRVNSGRFGVPWEDTVRVLEGVDCGEGWDGCVQVWDLE